jgi:hypothetical protein
MNNLNELVVNLKINVTNLKTEPSYIMKRTYESLHDQLK